MKKYILKFGAAALALVIAVSMFAACQGKKNDTTAPDTGSELPVADKHVVVFDLNGGVGSPVTQEVADGDKALALDAPTREGYDFIGWSGSPFYLDKYDFEQTVGANMTLYAVWTQKGKPPINVTFNVNGGTGVIKNAEFADGTMLLTAETPVKEGKVFVGWSAEKDKPETKIGYVNADTASGEMEKTLTVYAVWEAPSDAANLKHAAYKTLIGLTAVKSTEYGADIPEQANIFNFGTGISAYMGETDGSELDKIWYKDGVIYQYRADANGDAEESRGTKYPMSIDRAELLAASAYNLRMISDIIAADDYAVSKDGDKYTVSSEEIGYHFIITNGVITEIGCYDVPQTTPPDNTDMTGEDTSEVTSQSDNGADLGGDDGEEEGGVLGETDTAYRYKILYKHGASFDIPQTADGPFEQKYVVHVIVPGKGSSSRIVAPGEISYETLVGYAKNYNDSDNENKVVKLYREYIDGEFADEITEAVDVQSNLFVYVKLIDAPTPPDNKPDETTDDTSDNNPDGTTSEETEPNNGGEDAL